MKNDTLAQVARQVIEENTTTLEMEFDGDFADARKAQQYFSVKVKPVSEGTHTVSGTKENIIEWLTSKYVGMELDEAQDKFPTLFEKKKGKCEAEEEEDEDQIDEARFNFKEFDEMERVISNKGILKAFDHALGLITSDLLDAGYDEKKIMSFIVAMYERAR